MVPTAGNIRVNSHDRTEQKQAEAALREQQPLIQEQQKHIIRIQQTALAEVSTPLMPISEHVLVMPLIGPVDSVRAGMVMEALLEGVVPTGRMP